MPPELLNFLNGFTLMGIPAVILIPLFVEGLKRLGMPTHWSGVAALAMSALVMGLIGIVHTWPQLEYSVMLVVATLILGLAVPGIYSQVMLFAQGNPKPPADKDNAAEDETPRK